MTTDSEADDIGSPLCCATSAMWNVLENDATTTLCGSNGSVLMPSSSSACFVPSTTLGNAYDLILVRSQTTGKTACSEPTFSFGSMGASTNTCTGSTTLPLDNRVVLEVEFSAPITTSDRYLLLPAQCPKTIRFAVDKDLTIRLPGDAATSKMTMDERIGDERQHDPKALDMLASILESGCNRGRYLLLNHTESVIATAVVDVHLWGDQDRVAVVDIDGTITRSNIRGVYDTIFTQTYLHCHDGVCELLSKLPTGVRVVYLTSRPMSLSTKTRNFLSSLRQTDHCLPRGGLIGFTGSLTQMLFMELVYRSANEFKREALQRNVVRPFNALGVNVRFSAAFGNTSMDMAAYHAIGIDLHTIYLIDERSRIFCLDGDSSSDPKILLDRHELYLLAKGSSFEGYKDCRLLSRLSDKGFTDF